MPGIHAQFFHHLPFLCIFQKTPIHRRPPSLATAVHPISQDQQGSQQNEGLFGRQQWGAESDWICPSWAVGGDSDRVPDSCLTVAQPQQVSIYGR